MRNSLKWALSLACMATVLPVAHAWHHHYAVAVPVMGAPVQSVGVQSYALTSMPVQSYALQSYALTSMPVQSYALQSYALTSQPVQSYSVQSYSLVPTLGMSQGLTAQGVGTDLTTLLLNRLLGGGLTPGTTGGNSDVVRELQNNTAALKALTQAVKDNTAVGPDNTPTSGTSGIGLLPKIPGVNAQALQAAQAAYAQAMTDQYAEALGSKKPAPTTTTDILPAARAQIKAANDAVFAARLYLNAADSRNASDADEIKFLNDQLKKIGIPPAPLPKVP
jgi:hypothetical protein